LKKENCRSIIAIVVLPCNKILQIFKFVDAETSSGIICFPWIIFFLCGRRFHVIQSYGKFWCIKTFNYVPTSMLYFPSIKYSCHIINHIYLISLFVPNSESRTTVSSNSRTWHVRPPIWMFFICMEIMSTTQIGLG
jgi:hypothetical protein